MGLEPRPTVLSRAQKKNDKRKYIIDLIPTTLL